MKAFLADGKPKDSPANIVSCPIPEEKKGCGSAEVGGGWNAALNGTR